MGALFEIDDLGMRIKLYVSSARSYLPLGNEKYADFPNDEFKSMSAIHYDDLPYGPLWVEIRRFVERSLSDTVLYDLVNRSYWHQPLPENLLDNPRGYTVENHWFRFWFENETDQTMFNLRFADLVKPITPHHPHKKLQPTVNGRIIDIYGNFQDLP